MKSRTFFLFTVLIIAGHCNAQSFFAHKHASDIGRCEVVQKQKTVGQKLRNKVKYSQKRHNNEAFALREQRRKVRRQGYKL